MPINIDKPFEWLQNLKEELPAQINIDNQQNLRKTRIAILNLMPTVKETEQHWADVLSYNPNTCVELVFFYSLNRPSTKVDKAYLDQNYYIWENYDFGQLDGIVITGAPVELLDYEDVSFYNEVCEVISKSISHKLSIMLVCWAAQAALHYLYNIQKTTLPDKLFGVFEHRTLKYNHPLFKNLQTNKLQACVSRQTKINDNLVLKYTNPILASEIDGLDCLEDKLNPNIIYMFNHLEYMQDTLEKEFLRDKYAAKNIKEPYGYYYNNKINFSWKNDRKIFYSNWLDTF